MYDIVFCSLPYSDLDHVYSAPAILKGVVVTNGFTAKTIDFGSELFKQLDRDIIRFNQTQVYFISPDDNNSDLKKDIEQFYENCIAFFKNNPSKYIGISVLSISTQRAVFELCTRMKAAGIDSKIVIGGRGANVYFYSNVANHFKLAAREKLITFGEVMQKRNLVDHFIVGDGEDAIIELLQTNEVQTVIFKSDEFKSPVPDYDDYDFSEYLHFTDEIALPVTGSKGCVRDCDFCDVKHHFGKYRYRTGTDIATELIAVSEKTSIRKFRFTDSLVNGGFKPFMEFLRKLSEYNLANPDKKITWSGQYICRPQNEVPKDLYELLRDSGAEGLTIGAESGSNQVLAKMNKKTTVEALYDELEQLRAYGITCVLLTFVGHWSETWDDFVEHCKMLVNVAPYARSGTISAITLGYPYIFTDGTPALANHEINNIVIDKFDINNIWYNKDNPTNTFKERVYRRLIVQAICKKLNIPTIAEIDNLLYLTNYINVKHEEINDFFQTAS